MNVPPPVITMTTHSAGEVRCAAHGPMHFPLPWEPGFRRSLAHRCTDADCPVFLTADEEAAIMRRRPAHPAASRGLSWTLDGRAITLSRAS